MKKRSIRTKYALIISLFFAVLIAIFTLYFPAFILERFKDNYRAAFKSRVDLINEWIEESADSSAWNNISYLDILKHDRQIVFASVKYDTTAQIYPENIFTLSELQNLKTSEIVNVKNQQLLPVKLSVHNRKNNKIYEIFAGLKASRLISEYNNARNIVFIAFAFLALFSYLFIVFLDRSIGFPLKKLMNKINLISAGQLTYKHDNFKIRELDKADELLEQIVNEMGILRKESRQPVIRLEEELRGSEKKQKRIKDKLEMLSAFIALPREIITKDKKDAVYEQVNFILTERFYYHFSAVFLKEADGYRFHCSHVREFGSINDKVKNALSNTLLQDDSQEAKSGDKFRPFISDHPLFNDVLEKYNLQGSFIHLAVAQTALLVVGKAGPHKEFTDEDIRSLQLIADLLAYGHDTKETIKSLKCDVKARRAELETANELLSISLQNRDTALKLVSHDLGAPLRNISGLVDSIERKYRAELDDDVLQRLERIRNNINKERQMINHIMEHFKMLDRDVQSEPVDVKKIVRSVRNDLHYELNGKNVTIIVNEKLPVINSNPHLLEHIFLNLIDNACKYFPADGENNQIRVSFIETEKEIMYSIEDNGVGIPENKQKILFSAEGYKNIKTDDTQSGTGLGLALTRNLIDRLGGRVELDSEQGRGSKFLIVLKKGY